MANTLTGLIPDIYEAFDIVSREEVGFLPAVSRASSAERAALNESITYGKSRPSIPKDVTESMAVPEPDDKTVDAESIVITKSRFVDFGFTGNEQKGLNNGPGYTNTRADEIAQAIRALTNEMETDLATAAAAGVSRVTGTAGSAVFGSNLNEASQARKILVDNGAPKTDLQMLLNTTTGANLRTLYSIRGDRDFSREQFGTQGILTNINGMSVRESQANNLHTAGDASGATTDAAGYAKGATTINLASAGTGALLVGDVISFANHDDQYVIVDGDSDVSDGGDIQIQEPGLREAIPAAATAITVKQSGGEYNMSGIAFPRSAIAIATRLPALPEEGDEAVDRQTIVDPNSGIAMEFAIYQGFRKVMYFVGVAWGQKVIAPRHVSGIIGT